MTAQTISLIVFLAVAITALVVVIRAKKTNGGKRGPFSGNGSNSNPPT